VNRQRFGWAFNYVGNEDGVVMVPGAGHYPQSQRPGLTTGAVLRFLESVTGRA